MKKQVALALAAAFSLSVAGTALAAPANPFVDVPANHWAYDAISALQKDGVVDGYGDGTFRGDRTLTRYEMAAMIAKITYADGKHESLIKRLQSEFANELYNLGVRVDALEKNASTIKFTGDARIRYQQGPSNYMRVTESDEHKASRFQQRLNLNMTADVNDKMKFIGVLRAENTSNNYTNAEFKTSATDTLWIQRAEFALKNGNFGLNTGRLNPTLGQGTIWGGGRADGLLVGYYGDKFNFTTGYLDVSSEFIGADTVPSANAFVANLGFKLADRVNMTAAYFDLTNNYIGAFGLPADDLGVKLWGIGANAQLGKDFKLTGEYVKNSGKVPEVLKDAVGDKSWRVRLNYKTADYKKPGSYSLVTEYFKLGGAATFGSGTDAIAYGYVGQNSFAPMFGDGMKGWGLGGSYVPAKNVRMDLTYHWVNPYNGNFDNFNNAFTFATNFMF